MFVFSWLPINRCITLETKEQGGAVLETDVKEMRGMIKMLGNKILEMENGQNDVLDLLNGLDQKLNPQNSAV